MKCKNEYCKYMNNKECDFPNEIILDECSKCIYYERKITIYENTTPEEECLDFDERFLYE